MKSLGGEGEKIDQLMKEEKEEETKEVKKDRMDPQIEDRRKLE